jgi:type II secretory pathway pseudopilin PulG
MPSGRRAFTLIEIFTVITLMLVLVAVGGGAFTGVLDYYKVRKSAEQLLWDLRKVQVQAKARGLGAFYGLKFYAGGYDTVSQAIGPGFSYLTYGGRGSPVAPPDTIGALSTADRSRLVNLGLAVRVVQDGSVASPADILAGTRFQISGVGTRVQFDAQSPAFVDLYELGVGYFRLSVRNGSYVGLQIEAF